MDTYLQKIHSQGLINQEEYDALLPTGVQSAEELYAVTLHFPSLADVIPGNNLAKISAISARETPIAFRNLALSQSMSPIQFANGAEPPSNARFPLGSSTNTVLPKTSSSPGIPLNRIDHHSTARGIGWPVRDQGGRGTCVAHALAACKELLSLQSGTAQIGDASEQFLFWGAKQFDPNANSDGTMHVHALNALQHHGLCPEADWPYVPLAAATVHQGPPPASAQQAASLNLHTGGTITNNGNAAQLYQALSKFPVAIGVPVFADPNALKHDNWNVSGLLEFGRVLDPQPRSVVTGGHAVCVVGFEPDSREPSGHGWFIIRNSWGTNNWGHRLPLPGSYWGPEAGYGQISWYYVDSFLWEMCSLT